MHFLNLSALKLGWFTLTLQWILHFSLTHGLLTSTNESLIEVMRCNNNNHSIHKDNMTPTSASFVTNYQPFDIRFNEEKFSCNFGTFKAVVPTKIEVIFDGGESLKGNISSNAIRREKLKTGRFYSNGNLEIGMDSYSPTNYCIDQFNSNEIVVSVCTQECSQGLHCIRKCCEGSALWDISAKACRQVDSTSYWNPPVYTFSSDCVERIPVSIGTQGLKFIPGLPKECLVVDDRNVVPSVNIPNHGLGRFRLLLNGSVLINHETNGSWNILQSETYCIDGMQNYGVPLEDQTEYDQVLLVCKRAYKVRDTKKKIPVKYAMMLFSAATILLINIIVYLLLWDKHNIYEWTVFFEVIAMLFMIVFVASSHTIARNPNSGHLTSGPCIFLGVASHFFFLATFFWLLVINFEIWWNFRILTITNKKSRRWLRLLTYQFFAWGCPTVIIATGLILDNIYGLQNDDIDCPNVIVPNYGQTNCYISKRAQGPYLYYPVGVLLGCNLLFYTLTVFKMCEYQKNSQAMTQNRNRGHFQPVVVFARLFIVMGVSWIFEIVTWAVSPTYKGVTPLYWVVFDIVTLLQAIAIFVIFICRKDILQKLEDKYPRLKPYLAPFFQFPCCGLPRQVQPSPRSVDNNDLNSTAKRSAEDMTPV